MILAAEISYLHNYRTAQLVTSYPALEINPARYLACIFLIMDTNNNPYLISYRTLRQLIGLLGILLPFMCWMVNAWVNHLDLLNNPLWVDIGTIGYFKDLKITKR